MNKDRRERRLEKARGYSADCRERRIAAGRPARSDVASALLVAFLEGVDADSSAALVRILQLLVNAGFSDSEARDMIAGLIRRHRENQC